LNDKEGNKRLALVTVGERERVEKRHVLDGLLNGD
jgi:hypothetical protein